MNNILVCALLVWKVWLYESYILSLPTVCLLHTQKLMKIAPRILLLDCLFNRRHLRRLESTLYKFVHLYTSVYAN